MRPDRPQRDSWIRRVRRAGAIAIAMLLVVCTVAVQTGEAAVAHVRCQEHGQLIHVTSVAPDTGADRAPGLARVTPARGSALDHEHCAVLGTTYCSGSSLAPSAVSIVATLALRMPIASEHTARTTFRLAPKTSPPE
jgi:hypothetical protein